MVLSDGSRGFYYLNNWQVFFVEAKSIKVISTTGAGDSLLAGFIYAHSHNFEITEKLMTIASFAYLTIKNNQLVTAADYQQQQFN